MNRCLAIFFTVLFSFVSVMLFSQENNTKKDPTGWKKADKLYQQKGYMSSATKYQMKHDENKMSPEVMARVANSYRLNGEAEANQRGVVPLCWQCRSIKSDWL